ncbi:CBS domain-containing protein [Kribbella ginsengisoli]|uniref:CBS domain-containing protein n=1 Tax=Kribbella ginsengisoli TaxID=363865 RepID=A0ABP6YXK8_9ACTN
MRLDDRYRLESQVTGPSQWPAWSGRDERLDRRVTALFPPAGSVTSQAVQQYSRLADDQLVRIIDIDVAEDPRYLITESYAGTSLADLSSSGRLTMELAIELVAEAAGAVATVHANGLAYGALAAGTISWTDSGLVKLLDVALADDDLTAARHRDTAALCRMLGSALPAGAPAAVLAATNAGTPADLAAALEPFRPADAPLRRHLVSPEPVHAPHRLASRRVREVMATEILTVSEDTPVLELAEILARCHLPAVPVVDAAGRVTGMVSAADLERWRFAGVSV